MGMKHIRDHFTRFGLQVHLGTWSTTSGQEDVKSKTEAMYFPPYDKRKDIISEDLLSGSYDVSNGQFVSFCSSFKYLGAYIMPTLDDTFDIDARITLATKVWHALHPVLTNERICHDIQKCLYLAIPVNILHWGCDLWDLAESHQQKLKAFHNKNARSLCFITRWHCQHHKQSMKDIFEKKLKMLPIEKMINLRQIHFLKKVAHQKTNRLT